MSCSSVTINTRNGGRYGHGNTQTQTKKKEKKLSSSNELMVY